MWKDLDALQKAEVIKMAVSNGMRDLKSIRSFYDSTVNGHEFKKGGSLEGSQSNTANYAIRFFQKKGLPLHAAQGLVASLGAESSLNPNSKNPNGGAYGLAQWLGSRKKEYLRKYGNDPSNINNQLEFIWKELQTTHKRGLEKLRNSKSAEEAAVNAFGWFEFSVGPEGAVADMNKHHQNGEKSYNDRLDWVTRITGKPVDPSWYKQTKDKKGTLISATGNGPYSGTYQQENYDSYESSLTQPQKKWLFGDARTPAEIESKVAEVSRQLDEQSVEQKQQNTQERKTYTQRVLDSIKEGRERAKQKYKENESLYTTALKQAELEAEEDNDENGTQKSAGNDSLLNAYLLMQKMKKGGLEDYEDDLNENDLYYQEQEGSYYATPYTQQLLGESLGDGKYYAEGGRLIGPKYNPKTKRWYAADGHMLSTTRGYYSKNSKKFTMYHTDGTVSRFTPEEYAKSRQQWLLKARKDYEKKVSIPHLKNKEVVLAEAGSSTGARFSTNVLDSIAKYANKIQMPIGEAIGLFDKESTLWWAKDRKAGKYYDAPAKGNSFVSKDAKDSRYYPTMGSSNWAYYEDTPYTRYLNNTSKVSNEQIEKETKARKKKPGEVTKWDIGLNKFIKEDMKFVPLKNPTEDALERFHRAPEKWNPGGHTNLKTVRERWESIKNSPQIQNWMQNSAYYNKKAIGGPLNLFNYTQQ